MEAILKIECAECGDNLILRENNFMVADEDQINISKFCSDCSFTNEAEIHLGE